MSQQKKQKVNITNRKLLERLLRLSIVKTCKIEVVVAYIGLLLVSGDRLIPFPSALRIIHASNLHNKIKYGSSIPCKNILEALIHLVIHKRKLLDHIFNNPNHKYWSSEVAGPLFDIMYDISKIYKL